MVEVNDMEYLQIFDQNGNPVNAKIARKRKKETPNGFYIKTVIVYIENSKGEFLIQKHQIEKEMNGQQLVDMSLLVFLV